MTAAAEEAQVTAAKQDRVYYGEEMMRKRIQTVTSGIAVLMLGAILVACSGSDAENREARKVSVTPTPVVTSTPTMSPTPTPDPNAYISEMAELTTQGSVTLRETYRYDEEGLLLEAVTEQKAADAADDAWELVSRKTRTGDFSETRVTERYEGGVLQSVQTEYTEEDGATRTTYVYYTDGVVTQRDTDETDGNGRAECSRTEFFGEEGALTYSREVYYRDDVYSTPLLVTTVGADGVTTRKCPDNRYIAAGTELPALACVEVSEPGRDIYFEIQIGSFHTRLRTDSDAAPVADCKMYIMDEAYDGCRCLKLFYTADGKADLYCAKLGTRDNEEILVWNLDRVTQKRVSTDKNDSFRIVDVHEDGTEIIRSETKNDSNRRPVSQETFDSLGNLTSSVKFEYSSDGRISTSRELIKKDNGTEAFFVKTSERGDDGKIVRTEQYTQEGSEVFGKKQWEYSYNERGYISSCVCTLEDGTAVETTYTYTFSSKKK